MKTAKVAVLFFIAGFSVRCSENEKFMAHGQIRDSSSFLSEYDSSEAVDVSKLPGNVDASGAGGPQPGQGSELDFATNFDCNDSEERIIKVGSHSGADYRIKDEARVEMSIKGRLCPDFSSKLTVLFILDFSGSMGPSQVTSSLPPGTNNGSAGQANPQTSSMSIQNPEGNDPRADKSCGRLQAAEAILANLRESDQISVGTVAFASGVVESHTTAPTSLASFRSSQLNESTKLNNFCSYVPPKPELAKHEMAVQNSQVGPATNYEAALDRAYDFLRNVKGRKAIYFITDGRPTISNSGNPIAAAKKSVEQLKSIENLQLNAFFLQNRKSGFLEEDKVGFENLISTIGSKERVVKVESASQLGVEASKVLETNLDSSTIEASISVEGYKTEGSLKIKNFVRESQDKKSWLYETQGFVLLGQDNKVINHLIKIKAKGTDGTVHSSQIRILYTKTAQ